MIYQYPEFDRWKCQVTSVLKSREHFKRALNEDEIDEHGCREYLLDGRVIQLLSKYTPEKIVAVAKETTGFFGRSDFCLTVLHRGGRRIQKETYIWELKSPSCKLFVKDNKQRYRPSPDLVSAENQLLHYVEHARRDEMFQKVFDTDRDQIHFGGIIIGRSCSTEEESSEFENGLADIACTIRMKYFYSHNGIRLMVWDWVLDMLDDLAMSNLKLP